jgi:hypothetical protein
LFDFEIQVSSIFIFVSPFNPFIAMDSKITSTSIAAAPPLINESAVINASLSSVWRLVKLKEFVNFYTAISKSELVSSANEEKDIVRWTFQDGTVLEVKEEEYSVRFSLDHTYTSQKFCAAMLIRSL